MASPVFLLALATAVPPHVVQQAFVEARAREVFARAFACCPKLSDIFRHAGIETRYAVRPPEWYEAPHDWRDRNDAYLEGAGALFVQAAKSALTQAGIVARDVDVIVTVSSTGIATPSLEARFSSALGLRDDVARVPVFGLGCAGGVSGLSIASRLARADPGAIVLAVTVELCTLAFRRDRNSAADVVATALFGDGAAAAVLRAGDAKEGTARIIATAEHTWPGTLDIMGWSIDPIGFGVVLSRALPRFVEERLAAPARRFLANANFARFAPRFICHPGGAKVLAAIETALELKDGVLAIEREVLREYGNMSAPSVLFVLERVLARGLSGRAVLSALGPGFTASFVALEADHV